MNTLILELHDATQAQTVPDVVSFVGEDVSGSFGLLPGHARTMAVLEIGLARFRTSGSSWTYLAVPGAVLYFRDDVLNLYARRFLLDDDLDRISQALQDQLLAEERSLRDVKESLRRMEEQVLQRLWRIGREGA